MARSRFEDLEVYKLAERLADAVWEMVEVWPAIAQHTVGKQLIRAADSIGANIAEGVGRSTPQDNRRFVRIARGSLYETKHWLRRAYRRKLLSDNQVKILQPLVDELAPRLNAYLRSIGDDHYQKRLIVADRSSESQSATDHQQLTTDNTRTLP